jgi:hypothetical protein
MSTTSTTILPKPFDLTKGIPIKEWLRDFELLSKVNKWKEENQILYLSIFLEGTIKTWFLNQKITTWEAAKKSLEIYATLPNNSDFVRRELKKRIQGENESVEHYAGDIMRLCYQLDSNMDEEELGKQFFDGLHPSFQQKLVTSPDRNFTLLKAQAKLIEQTFNFKTIKDEETFAMNTNNSTRIRELQDELRRLQTQERDDNSQNRGRNYQSPSMKYNNRDTRTPEGKPKCQICKKIGHTAYHCYFRYESKTQGKPITESESFQETNLTRSNNQGATLLTTTCQVSGHQVYPLIDTASTTTIISEEFRRKIPAKFVSKPKNILMANHTTLKTLEEVEFQVTFGKQPMKIRAIVTRNFSHDMLIGNDVLMNLGAMLDLQKMKLILKNRISLPINKTEVKTNGNSVLLLYTDNKVTNNKYQTQNPRNSNENKSNRKSNPISSRSVPQNEKSNHENLREGRNHPTTNQKQEEANFSIFRSSKTNPKRKPIQKKQNIANHEMKQIHLMKNGKTLGNPRKMIKIEDSRRNLTFKGGKM